MARTPALRKYDLLKIQAADSSALLPIISDDPDAIQHSPLRDWIVDAGATSGELFRWLRSSLDVPLLPISDFGVSTIRVGRTDEGVATLDPLGPWMLEGSIRVPDCNSTVHFSTSHESAMITVLHSLKIVLRVERGDDEALDAKGNRKKFDIVRSCGLSGYFM